MTFLRWRAAVVAAGMMAALGSMTLPACNNRDCAEDRAGDVRCVGNRIETCNADGTVTYESCSDRDLVCSAELAACVTEEVAMSGTGGSGAAGGAAATGGAGTGATGAQGGAGGG